MTDENDILVIYVLVLSLRILRDLDVNFKCKTQLHMTIIGMGLRTLVRQFP